MWCCCAVRSKRLETCLEQKGFDKRRVPFRRSYRSHGAWDLGGPCGGKVLPYNTPKTRSEPNISCCERSASRPRADPSEAYSAQGQSRCFGFSGDGGKLSSFRLAAGVHALVCLDMDDLEVFGAWKPAPKARRRTTPQSRTAPMRHFQESSGLQYGAQGESLSSLAPPKLRKPSKIE